MTAGVSLLLLLAGTLIVGMVWSEQRIEWNEATRTATYDHAEVYVPHLGVVRFPSRSTDQQIKEELDRATPVAIQTAATRGAILLSLRAANLTYTDVTDSQLASRLLNDDPSAWSALSDVVLGDGIKVTLLPSVPPSLFRLAAGREISHLYLAASPGEPSMLYTRGEAVKAAAFSDGRAAFLLRELAPFYDSPRPRPKPLSLFRALALVVIGSVGAPWGIFLSLRWLVRSFSRTVNPDDVTRHVHVCRSCQSQQISRDERGDIFERIVLKVRGRLPYRCLDCDSRFLDRPLSRH